MLQSTCFERIFLTVPSYQTRTISEAITWLFSNCLQGINGVFLSYYHSKKILSQMVSFASESHSAKSLLDLFEGSLYYLSCGTERVEREADLLGGEISQAVTLAVEYLRTENKDLQRVIMKLFERLSQAHLHNLDALCDARVCGTFIKNLRLGMDLESKCVCLGFISNMVVGDKKQRRAVIRDEKEMFQIVSDVLIVGETEARMHCLKILRNFFYTEDDYDFLSEVVKMNFEVVVCDEMVDLLMENLEDGGFYSYCIAVLEVVEVLLKTGDLLSYDYFNS